MRRPTILFVHNHPMRFVEIDRDLLQERYEVTELYLKKGRLNPVSIFRRVQDHDFVFAWFASLHVVFPLLFARILGKPSILVIGGYDLACLPEIGYGLQQGGGSKWVSRAAMHLASCLMTNSYYSQEEAEQNAGINTEDVTVVYHGVDAKGFSLQNHKEPLVITVGNVIWSNLTRKGMESFVRAAQYLPEVPFVLIGRWRDQSAAEHLQQIAPPNVTLTGYVSDEELVEYMQKAKVYVQPSAHEGFGLSVAEAMLCGCIPVVTAVGALPEVVGNTGIYVQSQESQDVAKGIETALAIGAQRGEQAHKRIIKEFPLENRREGLFEIVERMMARR